MSRLDISFTEHIATQLVQLPSKLPIITLWHYKQTYPTSLTLPPCLVRFTEMARSTGQRQQHDERQRKESKAESGVEKGELVILLQAATQRTAKSVRRVQEETQHI